MQTANRTLIAGLAFGLTVCAGGCTPEEGRQGGASAFIDCPAAEPAMAATDGFMEAFNRKDMAGLDQTFHYPHMRIASYPLTVWTGPGQQDDVSRMLTSEVWKKSRWEIRTVVSCSPDKAPGQGACDCTLRQAQRQR